MSRGLGRRRLLRAAGLLGGAVAVAPLAGCRSRDSGRAPPRARHVGLLWSTAPPPEAQPTIQAFREGLARAGWREGEMVLLEYRWAEFDDTRLPALAAELVQVGVDVILTNTTPATLAAKQATTTIPIVQPQMLDPVGSGLVQSLARPGGNVTGLSFIGPLLSGKRVELLREVVPGVSRVGVIWNAANSGSTLDYEQTRGAADASGLEVLPLPVRGPADFDAAFHGAVAGAAGALIALPEFLIAQLRDRIIAFAAEAHLPAMYGARTYVASGGLISYGPDGVDLFRRAAVYVDKILRGASAAELPVEQPELLELAVNLTTARTLGLTIPPAVLARATEVIQ